MRRSLTIEVNPRLLWTTLVLVAAGTILWMVAPLSPLHWIIFNVFWMHPTGWVLIALAIAIVIAIGYAEGKDNYGDTPVTFAVGVLLALGLLGYWFFSAALARTLLVQNLQPEYLTVLPETTEVRYLPMPVAEKFGANQIQDPSHHLGDMDPLDTGEELSWVAPLIPTGFWNWLTGQTSGFVIVHSDGQIETVRQNMRFGEGMQITDGITWPLWRIKYTSNLTEFYYIQDGEEVLTVAPYLSYRYEFPVRIPYWGGVFVVHADGQIEDLTPEEAIADSRFVDQRLYPERLAWLIADAWEYRDGILNAWFTHQDQAQIPVIANERNQMPYLLPTEEGPMWFIGMEPYGPAYSIFKVLFVNAHDGTLQLYELPAESGMISPNQAGGYVRAAFPTYQWHRNNSEGASGNLLVIEPRPLIKNGILYWMMSITNNDLAGVTQTVLVNAENNNVTYFEDEGEIQQFVAGTFSGHSTAGAVAQEKEVSANSELNLNEMSTQELWDLLQQIISELESR